MSVQLSAVAAVGIAEGTSHVNWRLLAKILLWWIVGFCLTMVTTSALIAQGNTDWSFRYVLRSS